MKALVNLDDDTFHKASILTGIRGKDKLIQKALQNLISEKVVRNLLKLKGSYKKASIAARRLA